MSATDVGVAKLKCPVCPFSGIEPGAEKCPQCGTDLSPIRRVRSLAARFHNDALQEYGRGNIAAAVAKVNASLAIDADFPRARILLGKLLWKQGYLEAALDQWQRAQALSPDVLGTGELIAEALKHIRARVGRRRAVKISTISLGIVVAFALVLVPGSTASHKEVHVRRTLTDQIESVQVAARNVSEEFLSYRSRFSRTDSEYRAAQAQGESAARRMRETATQFADYREEVSRERAAILRELQGHAHIGKDLDAVLRVLPPRQQSAVGADSVFGHRGVLLTLVRALRPAAADTLLADIAAARSDIEALGQRGPQTGGIDAGILAGLRRRSIALAIRRKTALVDSLTAEYSRQYAMWDTVIGILDRRDRRMLLSPDSVRDMR